MFDGSTFLVFEEEKTPKDRSKINEGPILKLELSMTKNVVVPDISETIFTFFPQGRDRSSQKSTGFTPIKFRKNV